ncbi:MAG: CRISPR-associated protein Cas4 [Pseudomonadota bacterium]|nr:CRISPR-associated protein Cas4 [Pseudomonadota bacterium]
MVDDPIPISALNQYAYCPRRCYLIHAEGEFEDNVHTLRGTHEHERVDRQRHEVSAGVRVEYALPVWGRRLGLSGRCDAVEFHPDGTVYPVEYKHGKRRRWINDDLQLAAQALCLEEMLERAITKGAIYHQQSRRRREVIMNEALRREVEITVAAVRVLLSKRELPPITEDPRRCGECSLREICQPDLARAACEIMGIKAHLFEPKTKPCDGTPYATLYLAVK